MTASDFRHPESLSEEKSSDDVEFVVINSHGLDVDFWGKIKSEVSMQRHRITDSYFVSQTEQNISNPLIHPKLPKFQIFDPSVRSPVWIIGDLHGDLLSFISLRSYISTFQEEDPHVILLGDLVDDGGLDVELVCCALGWIAQLPGSRHYIQGNHDIGISYNSYYDLFQSSVVPSDFCERLNSLPKNSHIRAFTKTALDFFNAAPCAILLPDGLLIAHGGVPHVDLLDKLHEPRDLNNPAMVSDFIWTRIHESARRKLPNRSTRGCSLGFEDFSAFCDRATSILGRPIVGLVRGHDHVPERFLIHKNFKRHPVLTINAMCKKTRGDVFGPAERVPVAVRWQYGKALEIHRVEIPSWLIRQVYPESGALSSGRFPTSGNTTPDPESTTAVV